MNMGVPGYNIASTLSLIIAQRLARKLCPQCKRETSIPRPELLRQGFTEAEIDTPDFKIFEAVGCDQCDKSGYKSRTGIYPVMRSEEHTYELQSLMRISYAVFCLTQTTKN